MGQGQVGCGGEGGAAPLGHEHVRRSATIRGGRLWVGPPFKQALHHTRVPICLRTEAGEMVMGLNKHRLDSLSFWACHILPCCDIMCKLLSLD